MSYFDRKPLSKKKLLSLVRPGDVVFRGSQADYPKENTPTSLYMKTYYRFLKPLSGSLAPHAMLAVSPKTVIHQETNIKKGRTSKEIRDRFLVLRPRSQKKIGDVIKNIKRRFRQKNKYDTAEGAIQGALSMFPRKLRNALSVSSKEKETCTAAVAKSFHEAGIPVIKGTPHSAITKDLLKSKAFKYIGWSGKPASKYEEAQMSVVPWLVGGALLSAPAILGLLTGKAVLGKILSSRRKQVSRSLFRHATPFKRSPAFAKKRPQLQVSL